MVNASAAGGVNSTSAGVLIFCDSWTGLCGRELLSAVVRPAAVASLCGSLFLLCLFVRQRCCTESALLPIKRTSGRGSGRLNQPVGMLALCDLAVAIIYLVRSAVDDCDSYRTASVFIVTASTGWNAVLAVHVVLVVSFPFQQVAWKRDLLPDSCHCSTWNDFFRCRCCCGRPTAATSLQGPRGLGLHGQGGGGGGGGGGMRGGLLLGDTGYSRSNLYQGWRLPLYTLYHAYVWGIAAVAATATYYSPLPNHGGGPSSFDGSNSSNSSNSRSSSTQLLSAHGGVDTDSHDVLCFMDKWSPSNDFYYWITAPINLHVLVCAATLVWTTAYYTMFHTRNSRTSTDLRVLSFTVSFTVVFLTCWLPITVSYMATASDEASASYHHRPILFSLWLAQGAFNAVVWVLHSQCGGRIGCCCWCCTSQKSGDGDFGGGADPAYLPYPGISKHNNSKRPRLGFSGSRFSGGDGEEEEEDAVREGGSAHYGSAADIGRPEYPWSQSRSSRISGATLGGSGTHSGIFSTAEGSRGGGSSSALRAEDLPECSVPIARAGEASNQQAVPSYGSTQQQQQQQQGRSAADDVADGFFALPAASVPQSDHEAEDMISSERRSAKRQLKFSLGGKSDSPVGVHAAPSQPASSSTSTMYDHDMESSSRSK